MYQRPLNPEEAIDINRIHGSGDVLLSRSGETRVGGYVAVALPEGLLDGQGPITPPDEFDTPAGRDRLIVAGLGSLEEVPTGEKTSSICTDGRVPSSLESGEPAEIRPQLAGASMGTGHYMFEMLGLIPEHLEGDDRVNWTAEKLVSLGFQPCAHPECAACLGFNGVNGNIVQFDQEPLFGRRVEALSIPGVYDTDANQKLAERNAAWLADPKQSNLSPTAFLEAARHHGGSRAVTKLVVEERGHHGHVEGGVVHVRVPGRAISEREVALKTGGELQADGSVLGGGELFGINDDTTWDLAVAIAAEYGDEYLRPALIAGTRWPSGCHRSLLTGEAPTWIVTAEDSEEVTYEHLLARVQEERKRAQLQRAGGGVAALEVER